MNNAVNSEISLLASQQDGAAILDTIRAAIATPPTPISDAQQASLSRANLMLASAATIAPRAPPAARTIGIQDVDFTCYAGGGDINAWISQACQAAGVPANSNWMHGLLTLSDRESGNSSKLRQRLGRQRGWAACGGRLPARLLPRCRAGHTADISYVSRHGNILGHLQPGREYRRSDWTYSSELSRGCGRFQPRGKCATGGPGAHGTGVLEQSGIPFAKFPVVWAGP